MRFRFVNAAPTKNYIPSLDGLRAISIMIVFIGHAFKAIPFPGGLGVTIFFFISGYLITTLMCREVSSNGFVDLKAFYLRRVLRLAPPLCITLALGILLVKMGWIEGTLNSVGLISQFLFFFNYWDAYNGEEVISGTKILWSLSVEEHFYFIFPILFILAIKNNWRAWWMPALCGVVLIWRLVKFQLFGATEWQIYALTDTRFDSMLWGCFLAVITESGSNWLIGKSEKACRNLALAGLFGILISLLVREELFRSTLRYTIQGISLVPIFFYALKFQGTISFRILNSRIMKFLGVCSYTFYLTHYIILNSFSYNDVFQSEIIRAIFAGFLAILFAYLIQKYVEVPVKAWRAGLHQSIKRDTQIV